MSAKENLLGQFRALLPKAPPPSPKKDTKMSKKTAGLADREYMPSARGESAGRHVGGAVRRIADAAERGIHAAGGPLSAGIGGLQGALGADPGDGFGGAIAGVAGTAAANGLVDHIPPTSPRLRAFGTFMAPLIGGHVGGRLYSRVKRIAVGPRGEPAPPPVDYGSYEDARQKWAAAAAEQVKAAGLLQRVGQTLTQEGGRAGHIAEVAGLGMLAANPIDELQAKARSKPGEEWEHKSLLGGEKGHAINDIAGLGVLAAPSVAHLLQHKHVPKLAAAVRPGGDVVTVRSHVRRRKTTEKRAFTLVELLALGPTLGAAGGALAAGEGARGRGALAGAMAGLPAGLAGGALLPGPLSGLAGVAAGSFAGGALQGATHRRPREKGEEKRAAVSTIPLEVGFFHELEKVGTITPEEARESLERLDAANKSTGSPEQVRRYAALGAAAGLATDVGSSFVSGAPFFKAPPGTPFARTRAIGASALRGAVASGAIPLVRAGLDRAAETATLRRYVAENPTTPTEG